MKTRSAAAPRDASSPAARPADAPPPRSTWQALLPELQRFPAHERDQALRVASRTPLQALELAGMAAALVAVTALTKFAAPDPGLDSRLALALLNFAVALPLLVAALGPFHLRRLRRGLRAQLQPGEGA